MIFFIVYKVNYQWNIAGKCQEQLGSEFYDIIKYLFLLNLKMINYKSYKLSIWLD